MQKEKENIIRFKSKPCKSFKEQAGKITRLTRKTLFKHAFIVCIENETLYPADILVDNGKIEKIEKEIVPDESTLVEDLCGRFVLPIFYNAFEDFNRIFNIAPIQLDRAAFDLRYDLMVFKNILSGVKPNFQPMYILSDIDQAEEHDLSQLSNELAANKLKTYLQVGCTLEEMGQTDKKFGKSLPHVLEDFGFLDRDFTLVSGNCLEKDDLQVFLNYGNKFVITPYEDGQMGRRPTNLVTLKNMGFDVRIGAGSAFEIDFFSFMRQILMTQWGMFEDKSVISEKDVLLMATNGVSTIEEGKDADFMVLNSGSVIYEKFLNTFVWGKSKQDVYMTVIGGKIAQKSGVARNSITGLDYEELKEEINKLILGVKDED